MDLMLFPARRYRFVLEAETPLDLPAYKGSTFRGAFGHAFRRVACALRRQDCETCLLRFRCAYIQVFETPVREEERVRGVNTFAPHPFVLEPPMEARTAFEPGEILEAGLVLIGRALDLLPYFIYAVDEMGRGGLGRGRALLREVGCEGVRIYDSESRELREGPEQGNTPSPLMGERQACPERSRRGGGDQAKIEFLTPLRLKVRNRYTDSPTFTDLLEHLVARVEALARYHGPATNGLDGAEALAAARQVRVARVDLRWHDWERYSARQETRMKLGGVVGRMEVEGVPDSLWPWLRLGEMIHVGKGTSFGLGRYRVRISKPAQPAQEHR